MGYLHIDNLYKNKDILLFRECYALEKIHGTSAHLAWDGNALAFFPGGEKLERFVAIFDGFGDRLREELTRDFASLPVTIYGEAYGGSQQGQKWRYGDKLRFVAFDVQVGGRWLSVPAAYDLVQRRSGFEFVSYERGPTDLVWLDAQRDAPSVQAKRNGIEKDVPREGVVLRPLIEVTTNNGERIIAKHKRDEERETKAPRDASLDPAKLAVLENADAIAEEWVTETRLSHVLDKIETGASGMEHTPKVIKAMVEDVLREGAGELVDSKEARAAIGRRAAKLFHARVKAVKP